MTFRQNLNNMIAHETQDGNRERLKIKPFLFFYLVSSTNEKS